MDIQNNSCMPSIHRQVERARAKRARCKHPESPGRDTRQDSGHSSSGSSSEDSELEFPSVNVGDTLGGFIIGRQISSGTYCRVYAGRRANDTTFSYVVKIFTNTPDYKDVHANEIRAHTQIGDHHHVISLVAYGKDAGVCYMVLERASRDLFTSICSRGPMPLPVALKALKQVLLAMSYLHDRRVSWGDVKGENILVVPTRGSKVSAVMKISDFGSCIFQDDDDYEIMCTSAFRSPETIIENTYTPSADIWALGCLLFEMVTGEVLFSEGVFMCDSDESDTDDVEDDESVDESVDELEDKSGDKSEDESEDESDTDDDADVAKHDGAGDKRGAINEGADDKGAKDEGAKDNEYDDADDEADAGNDDDEADVGNDDDEAGVRNDDDEADVRNEDAGIEDAESDAEDDDDDTEGDDDDAEGDDDAEDESDTAPTNANEEETIDDDYQDDDEWTVESCDDGIECDNLHISMMIALLGPFPRVISVNHSDLFSRRGHLRDDDYALPRITILELLQKHGLNYKDAQVVHDLMTDMLMLNPRRRPAARQLLNHKSLRTVDVAATKSKHRNS